MTTVLAVGLGVIASLCFNYAMYLNKKAVDTLPSVRLKSDRSVLKAFFSNRTIQLAIVLMLLGAGIYAVAIGMAPISVVQPIVASGVVLLAYLAIKNLGEKPRRIDYYAIGMSVLGVVLIGVSLAEGLPEEVSHDPVELWVFSGLVVLLSVIIPLLTMKGSSQRQAAGLGVSVGLLYGLVAVFARLLLVDWVNRWSARGLGVVFSSVFLIAWLATLLPAVILLQAALQRGMAVVVVPILAGLSQLVPILGGMIALNEPFPENHLLTAVRITAFVLILLGTVILSRRAEETGPESQAGGPEGVAEEPAT